MLAMSVPILFALSDMSKMAKSTNLAAVSVSPFRPEISEAAKLVAVSIYCVAETPAVLYAFFALSKTML